MTRRISQDRPSPKQPNVLRYSVEEKPAFGLRFADRDDGLPVAFQCNAVSDPNARTGFLELTARPSSWKKIVEGIGGRRTIALGLFAETSV